MSSKSPAMRIEVFMAAQVSLRFSGLGSQRVPRSDQASVTTRPRNLGNLVGAWAKQNSRRLYCDRVVEQPFLAHTRWSATCLGGRLLPMIRLPLRTVSAM